MTVAVFRPVHQEHLSPTLVHREEPTGDVAIHLKAQLDCPFDRLRAPSTSRGFRTPFACRIQASRT